MCLSARGSASAGKVRKQITRAVFSGWFKCGEWLEDEPKKHDMKADLGRGRYAGAVETNRAGADWRFSVQKAPEKKQVQQIQEGACNLWCAVEPQKVDIHICLTGKRPSHVICL